MKQHRFPDSDPLVQLSNIRAWQEELRVEFGVTLSGSWDDSITQVDELGRLLTEAIEEQRSASDRPTPLSIDKHNAAVNALLGGEIAAVIDDVLTAATAVTIPTEAAVTATAVSIVRAARETAARRSHRQFRGSAPEILKTLNSTAANLMKELRSAAALVPTALRGRDEAELLGLLEEHRQIGETWDRWQKLIHIADELRTNGYLPKSGGRPSTDYHVSEFAYSNPAALHTVSERFWRPLALAMVMDEAGPGIYTPEQIDKRTTRYRGFEPLDKREARTLNVAYSAERSEVDRRLKAGQDERFRQRMAARA